MADQKLVDYIKLQLSANVDRGGIKKALRSAEWTDEEINEAFSAVESHGTISEDVVPEKATSIYSTPEVVTEKQSPVQPQVNYQPDPVQEELIQQSQAIVGAPEEYPKSTSTPWWKILIFIVLGTIVLGGITFAMLGGFGTQDKTEITEDVSVSVGKEISPSDIERVKSELEADIDKCTSKIFNSAKPTPADIEEAAECAQPLIEEYEKILAQNGGIKKVPTALDMAIRWNVFQNKEFGYEVSYPQDWEASISSNSVLLERKDDVEEGEVVNKISNVSIATFPASEIPRDFEKYAPSGSPTIETLILNTGTEFPDRKESRKILIIDLVEATKVTITSASSNWFSERIYFEKGDFVFSIAIENNNEFLEQNPIIDLIVSSFKFINFPSNVEPSLSKHVLDCYVNKNGEKITTPDNACVLKFTEIFESRLASCTPSTGSISFGSEVSDFGIVRDYEIFEEEAGSCYMEFKVFDNILIKEKRFIGKNMLCIYEPSERTLNNISNTNKYCTGQLSYIIQGF